MNTFTLERNNYRRKLIMLVKQHPILWNKTQENYNRNRAQKNLEWRQISEQLDISVDKLRRTWENLRDQYRRDLKREIRFGFKSKWRFFSDMDFIRDMVAYKEDGFKEIEFTDSDSEIEVPDNLLMQTQCSPITTTLVAPMSIQTTTTTPCTSTISSDVTCATNILPFQPIVLSKQWQPLTQELHANALYVAPNHPESTDLVDFSRNCDSSKDHTKSSNKPYLPYETVAKLEPDLEVETDNTIAIVDLQESTATKDNQVTRDFQEPRVSTSCSKRSRPSIEYIAETPTPTNSRNQIKNETDLNEKDDDYYFVMSLLPSLRQIPRQRKFPLRIGIMSLIAKDLEQVCKDM